MPAGNRRRGPANQLVVPTGRALQVDRASPFAVGLKTLVMPGRAPGGTTIENLASTNREVFTPLGGVAYTTGAQGVALDFTVGALRKTTNLPWNPVTSVPYTLAVMAETRTQPGTGVYQVISGVYRNNAGSIAEPYAVILLNGEAGQQEITLNLFLGSEIYLTGIPWPAVNQPFIFVATSRANNDHTMVLRNLSTGVITVLSHTDSAGAPSANVPNEETIGGSAPGGVVDTSNDYEGKVHASWMWDRGMTAAEATAFVQNPFGMLVPRRRIRTTATVSTDVTVNLTGVAGTGAVGTVVPTVAKTPTGVAGTGAVGTVVPTVAPTVTGVAGTGQVGTVAVKLDTTATLTGVAGTGQVGTVAPTVAPTVTGVAGTGAVGTVVPTVIPTVTGVAGTGAVGTVTVTTTGDVTVNLSGVAGTGAVGTVVPAVAPTVTGVAGTGAVGTVTPAVAFTPTGVAGTGAVGDVTITTTGDKVVNIASVEGTGQVGTLTVQADTPVVAGPGEFAWNASRFKRKKKPKRDQDDENEPPKPPGPPDHIPEEAAAITYDTTIPEYERAIAGVETAAREGLEKKRRLLLRERVRAARKAAEQDEEDSILLLLG